jgi:flagellar protein FliS
MNYQQQSLSGKNPVELVVALYDGMMRFLRDAIAATERGDTGARRVAIKRVFDILIHLQSRLRTDVGGNSAKALSEFYAAIFALCLEGSRLQSTERFEEAIFHIGEVRSAWAVAARDPEVLRQLEPARPHLAAANAGKTEAAPVSRWSA